MALTFYHVNWCPECIAVKDKLEALKVVYEDVVVPDVRMFRKQVHEVSGQYYVPVIKDGDLVLTRRGTFWPTWTRPTGKARDQRREARGKTKQQNRIRPASYLVKAMSIHPVVSDHWPLASCL